MNTLTTDIKVEIIEDIVINTLLSSSAYGY
jgi:hypothetical protein